MKLYEVTISSPWRVSPAYVVAKDWNEAAEKAMRLDLAADPELKNGGVASIKLIGDADGDWSVLAA